MSTYTLHGHLGGVLLLATTGLGDTLVSVGVDRVAKVEKEEYHLGPSASGVATPWKASCPNPVVSFDARTHCSLSLQRLTPHYHHWGSPSGGRYSTSLPILSVKVVLREPRMRDPVALRQVHLGSGLLLDPVTELLETPSMAIVAVTR